MRLRGGDGDGDLVLSDTDGERLRFMPGIFNSTKKINSTTLPLPHLVLETANCDVGALQVEQVASESDHA